MDYSKYRGRRAVAGACALSLLAACGGDGSPAPRPTPSPTATTPPPQASACSLRARQDWALAQVQEWYLFPDLINAGANPASYSDVQSYIDALVAPARTQSRDRYFTYLTSIEEENAYYEQGDNVSFGFRLGYDSPGNRVFVIEGFEGGPALANGLDRGTELLRIDIPGGASRSVATLMASGGPGAVIDALGPDTAGLTRVFHFRDASGVERSASLAKSEFELQPVSERFGAKIIDDGGKRVGYLNLRTFIGPADPALREAFAEFRAEGATELIVDLRYNGGGLISIAETLGDLMGRTREGQIFDYISFRESKSADNSSRAFRTAAQSIAPTRIAFIGTGGTASASELVINSMSPYLDTEMALIGSNTYGKPVGQIALDKPECDDRLRLVALKVENAGREGEYYNGLASTLPVTCAAYDDISRQLGDPQENMVATALDFLAGRSCTSFTAAAATASTQRVREQLRELLRPETGSTVQREVPGIF